MKKFINVLSVCLAFSLAGCSLAEDSNNSVYISIVILIALLILINILWSDKND